MIDKNIEAQASLATEAVTEETTRSTILTNECCLTFGRDFSETINGLYPPSDHSPACKNYKPIECYAVGIIGSGQRCIFGSKTEADAFMVENDDDEQYTVHKIMLTQDQLDKLSEFEGF